jgi:S1-C subfamily serine protease
MAEKVYFRHAGRIHGPIARTQILKLMEMGGTDPDDSWSLDGLSWQSMDALYDFAAAQPERSVKSSWVLPPSPEEKEALKRTVALTKSMESTTSKTWEAPVYHQSRLQSWLMPIGMGGVFLAVVIIVMSGLKPGGNGDHGPDLDPGLLGGAPIPGGGNLNAKAGEGAWDAKKLLGQFGPSVGLVVRPSDNGPVLGSGFLIRANYLITSAAVAGDDRGILIAVYFPDAAGDDKGPHQARLHHTDPATGLALLRLDASQPPLLFSETSLLKAGEDLVILAAGGLLEPKKPGALQTVNATYTTTTTHQRMECHRISAKAKPVFAGAPVFDRQGKVVGMVADPVPAADPLCLSSKQILKLVKDIPLP